ncbi:hypothetical protein AX018_10778 [Paracidovorax anthurii]|uniref:Uncharacterized protein n=2 Tax=Paracidovorax anthurii TaxID=78229 RepID=A0A328YIY7_9BURK|nr:hypothetical protein [Paracidovorax anthurii]RAR72715.1 hypothetical protein AX018_10778 [Paracidovorax anthurii]
MHASPLTSPPLPSPPSSAWRSGASRLVSRSGGPGVQLRLLSLVDPPVLLDDGFPQTSGLWVSSHLRFAGGVTSLTRLHLALQGLLLRLETLAGPGCTALNTTLRLLVDSRLTHVYASSVDFQRLTGQFSPAGSRDPSVVGIDEMQEWLVVDAQQSFENAAPSAALISSLVRMAEVPGTARRRPLMPGDATDAALGTSHALMLETARALAQRSLGDTAVALSQPAMDLAARLGPAPLLHWLLTDLPIPASVLMPSLVCGDGVYAEAIHACLQ